MTTYKKKIIRNFINITYCLLLITYNCASRFYLLIEVLGTISFAMSGSFAAMQKRFDPLEF